MGSGDGSGFRVGEDIKRGVGLGSCLFVYDARMCKHLYLLDKSEYRRLGDANACNFFVVMRWEPLERYCVGRLQSSVGEIINDSGGAVYRSKHRSKHSACPRFMPGPFVRLFHAIEYSR